MCTVTYLPLGEGVVITSNRDEKTTRARAIPPAEYKVGNSTLVYPKDPKAGGSWIAMNENGSMAVLLNGGWRKHQPEAEYHKSRGLVFLDIVSGADMVVAFYDYDLREIEPFTMVIYSKERLSEARWDGTGKHVRDLPVDEPQIWSSVTLYDAEMRQQRERWFEEWRVNHRRPTVNEIRDFHQTAGEGSSDCGLVINRDDHMKTVSVTSIHLTAKSGTMKYHDLLDNAEHSFSFSLVN
jgi:hypothetical protein